MLISDGEEGGEGEGGFGGGTGGGGGGGAGGLEGGSGSGFGSGGPLSIGFGFELPSWTFSCTCWYSGPFKKSVTGSSDASTNFSSP